MKETGLMFKAPLVRAILEGRKTQTRRIVKPQPAPDKRFQGWILYSTDRKRIGKASWGHGTGGLVSDIECIGSPCGQPGDRIYVRETWNARPVSEVDSGMYEAWEPYQAIPKQQPSNAWVYFEADGDEEGPWRPSIHMPKWAARIWLEVTGVRVERLQDISEKDAIAEGIERTEDFFGCPCWRDYSEPEGPDASVCPDDPIGSFQTLWESTGGDWDANPWVWVIDFRVLSTTGRPDQ